MTVCRASDGHGPGPPPMATSRAVNQKKQFPLSYHRYGAGLSLRPTLSHGHSLLEGQLRQHVTRTRPWCALGPGPCSVAPVRPRPKITAATTQWLHKTPKQVLWSVVATNSHFLKRAIYGSGIYIFVFGIQSYELHDLAGKCALAPLSSLLLCYSSMDALLHFVPRTSRCFLEPID